MTYPALYPISGAPLTPNHLFPAVLWGVATTLLPWVIFYPAFGWGFFGSRARKVPGLCCHRRFLISFTGLAWGSF